MCEFNLIEMKNYFLVCVYENIFRVNKIIIDCVFVGIRWLEGIESDFYIL